MSVKLISIKKAFPQDIFGTARYQRHNFGNLKHFTPTVPFQTACFPIAQALLVLHFNSSGGWYPVGGGSEVALNVIPVIERAGGAVLVRANVKQGR